MGTVHLKVQDLLRDGASLTIHCFCLRPTLWTPDTLQRFSPGWRVWTAVDNFRCASCGRVGRVRDMDVHDVAPAFDPHPARSPNAYKRIARKPAAAALR